MTTDPSEGATIPDTKNSPDIRTRSGSVDGGPMEGLFYLLMRDGELSPGVMEKKLLELVTLDGRPKKSLFSNGWLANYAADFCNRLRMLDEAYSTQKH